MTTSSRPSRLAAWILPLLGAGVITASALAVGALGSSGSSGSSGDSAHPHGPAVSTPLLPLSLDQRVKLGEELAAARTAAVKYPTVAAAEKAGLNRAGPYSAGSGAHYFLLSEAGRTEFDPSRPTAWLYSGTKPTSTIVGIMYYSAAATAPEGFVGAADVWHQHGGACYRRTATGGIDVPLPVDTDITKKMCDDVPGGEFIERTGWMLHAWVVPGWEAADGVFAHDHGDLVCADGSTTVANLATGCDGR